MPRALRLAALAVLALWTVFACGVEVGRAVHERRSATPRGYSQLRLDTPQADSLLAFAVAIGERVPPDRVIAFATGAGRDNPEFFQSLWVAYALPRHRVIRLSHPRAAEEAEYLAAYGPRIDHPRLGEPQALPGGWLYPVTSP